MQGEMSLGGLRLHQVIDDHCRSKRCAVANPLCRGFGAPNPVRVSEVWCSCFAPVEKQLLS